MISIRFAPLTLCLFMFIGVVGVGGGCKPGTGNGKDNEKLLTDAGTPYTGDPNTDHDGDGYTPNAGDCNDIDANVHPGAAELCNGIDDNCNGKTDEVCDYDGDGYTPDSGDCNDTERLVNPGAIEVVGNNVDDNCNNQIDEETPPCDDSLTTDAPSLAGQIELCAPWMVKAELNADSDKKARAALASLGVIKAKSGKGMIMLATGLAVDDSDPLFQPLQPGTEFSNDATNPKPMNIKNNICGMATADPMTVHDYVELKLTLKVPTNAQSFSFNFNFMTAEYPEWVGSSYNDKFLVLLDSKSFSGNIAFDKNNNPITVNVGFFNVCDSAPICNATKTNSCRYQSLADLKGTGYELDDGTGTPVGGGTGWLTTTAPVTPGETATLRFVIFDESDHDWDSSVLIDNFQWQLQAAGGPTTIQ